MVKFVTGLFLSAGWIMAVHFPPWVSWHNEVWVFGAVIWATGCLLVFERTRNRYMVMPMIVWAFLFLAGVVVAQAAVRQIAFSGDAWVLLFYLVLCIGAIGVGYQSSRAQTDLSEAPAIFGFQIDHFAVLVLLAGLSSTVLAMTQTLEVWDLANWIHRMPEPRRPGANLGQPNQLATLILFSIASLAHLVELRRIRGLAAMLLATILLFGLTITESRTGALSLFFLAGWWMLKRSQLNFHLPVRTVGLWLIFFAACFWFWPSFLNFLQIGSVADLVATQVNTSAGTRFVVWPQLWQAVWMHPWFGWGLGGVSVAHNAVLDGYTKGEPFTYAHNIVLDLAIGMGLPLTLFLVAVVGGWLWRRVRNANDTLSWYCLALVLPFGVHSMLEFPFAYAYLLVPVMFLLGVLEARLAPERVVRIPWRAAAAGWFVVSAAMAWSVYEYIVMEEDFRVARFEAVRIGQTASDYERPKIYILTQLNALMEGVRVVPAPNMPPQRIALVRAVAMKFPGAATQNRYALSLALNGNPDEALRQLKVMRAMHGEKTYEGIKANWTELANTKYPQLKALALP